MFTNGRLRSADLVDSVLPVGMALQHEPEHGGEHKQQRKDREDRVVGDERGKVAGLVLAELLDHRERKRQPPVRPLPAVELDEEALHDACLPRYCVTIRGPEAAVLDVRTPASLIGPGSPAAPKT